MELTASITSMILLCAMAWQDFRTRYISAWLLPAIGILLIVIELYHTDAIRILENAAVNCILLSVQFLMLSLWVSLRNRKWTGIINSHIGSGDIVLLVILTPVFAPLNFCIFLTAGTLITLVIHSLIRLLKPSADPKIPLAGYLGVSILLLSLLNIFSINPVRLSDGEWLFNYFIN